MRQEVSEGRVSGGRGFSKSNIMARVQVKGGQGRRSFAGRTTQVAHSSHSRREGRDQNSEKEASRKKKKAHFFLGSSRRLFLAEKAKRKEDLT